MVAAARNELARHRMCGRYAITVARKTIRRLFGYPEQPNFPPRYNLAPPAVNGMSMAMPV